MTTRIIAVANQKGGVGKTTTAVTLAHGLAELGKETLAVDLDPQGQVAVALGLAQEPGIFNVVVAGRPIAENVRRARRRLAIMPGDSKTAFVQFYLTAENKRADYLAKLFKPLARAGLDYLIFDTSPSLGGLQERAIYAADLVIVPSAVDFLSADAVAHTYAVIQRGIDEWGWQGAAWVLPTFFDDRTVESRVILSDLAEIYGERVLPPIHRATGLRECAALGKTIWELDNKCRAAQEYAVLVRRVMGAK